MIEQENFENESEEDVGPKYLAPECPANMNEAQFAIEVSKLKFNIANIAKIFVQHNSPQDVILPDYIRSELILDIEAKHYHPRVLDTAKRFVTKLLVNSSFPKFVKNAAKISFSAINVEAPKYTLNQIAMNEIPSPYTYQGKKN